MEGCPSGLVHVDYLAKEKGVWGFGLVPVGGSGVPELLNRCSQLLDSVIQDFPVFLMGSRNGGERGDFKLGVYAGFPSHGQFKWAVPIQVGTDLGIVNKHGKSDIIIPIFS